MKAKHGTLTANTVATQSIVHDTDTWVDGLCVEVECDGTAPVFFTTDGSTPTVGGDDTYIIRSGALKVEVSSAGTVTTKLISSGAPAYSVTVL